MSKSENSFHGWKARSVQGDWLYCLNLRKYGSSHVDSVNETKQLFSGPLLKQEQLDVLGISACTDWQIWHWNFEVHRQTVVGGARYWLKVNHQEFIELWGSGYQVNNQYSKMTSKFAYLADDDADRFKTLLTRNDISFNQIEKAHSANVSRINDYADFDVYSLLVSYFEGREFWHRETKQRATIMHVQRRQPNHITFVHEAGEELYRSTLALEVFVRRFQSLPPNRSPLPTQDMLRYATLGYHELLPHYDDSDYIDCVEEIRK